MVFPRSQKKKMHQNFQAWKNDIKIAMLLKTDQ